MKSKEKTKGRTCVKTSKERKTMHSRADSGIFDWGGPYFGSERTVELFRGKLLLTETITWFLICERRSLLAREILLCKQRRTDHRRVSVVNCNTCRKL